MSPSHIYGSIVIASRNPVQPFPQLKGGISGQHAEGRYRGIWTHHVTGSDATESDLILTQRDKSMRISVIGEQHAEVNKELHTRLTDLDSRFVEEIEGELRSARHLFKLNQLMQEVPLSLGRYFAVINNNRDYGSISLLVHEYPMHLVGVYDQVNMSVRIVWTSDRDFENDVRSTAPTRYVFYRFPIAEDRPVFLHTHNLCARWYDWTKAFQGTDGILRAFNVAETLLFRDPTVPAFARS